MLKGLGNELEEVRGLK
ncbi:rCG50141 [Rattus norvegicus]|uniref:RCG50141 n=1 Tax=Rattus norvegicus TaxID=10116 RepID=A6KU53_RAT|nr:rCG50141 [Rattus norvegicus]